MKRRRPLVDYAVYLVIRCLVAILQALPVRLAFRSADLLAALAYHADRRHREVAAENLRFAFPGHSPKQVDDLVRGCYRHFLRLVVEIVLMPRKYNLENLRKFGRIVRADRVLDAMLGDRPALIVTAHFGNWEFAGYALGAWGFRSYAIARVLDNPWLEGFFKKFRQATGQTIIAKKDDFGRLEEVLKTGGKVATLADQDAGPRGVFIDFFGRPASAHKAVALMAIEFDAVMVVVGAPRTGCPDDSYYYNIICEDFIDPREYASQPDAVKAITQRYHESLERMIRQYPEQYFWLHRRWKTAPAVKKSLAKAA